MTVADSGTGCSGRSGRAGVLDSHGGLGRAGEGLGEHRAMLPLRVSALGTSGDRSGTNVVRLPERWASETELWKYVESCA